MGDAVNKAKGKTAKAVVNPTGDKDLDREGKMNDFKGTIQGFGNDPKDAVKGAVKDAKAVIKKGKK